MSKIRIVDLEVHYHVGVPDEERAKPQRLLITVEMEHNAGLAAESDRLEQTIDYHQVVQLLLDFGQNRRWHLIEKVAADAAHAILNTFGPQSVAVEVKKFIIPQTRYISVTCFKSL